MTMKEKLNQHEQIETANKEKLEEFKASKKSTKRALLLKTDGNMEVIDYPADNVLDWCYKVIGCDLVQCVWSALLPKGMVIVVDEEGLLKSDPQINVIGSYLYGYQNHGNPIVGNALIIREEDTEEGCEFAGLSEDEATKLFNKFLVVYPMMLFSMSI